MYRPRRAEKENDMITNLTTLSSTVVTALRGDDSVTIAQLRAVMNTELGSSLRGMTMEDFLNTDAVKATKKTKAKANGEVSTRTRESREAYDASVLAFVKSGGKVAAADVRKVCGGTAHQARTSLNRLIATEELTYEGQARATKYFAA
jgi:hypothetical protein